MLHFSCGPTAAHKAIRDQNSKMDTCGARICRSHLLRSFRLPRAAYGYRCRIMTDIAGSNSRRPPASRIQDLRCRSSPQSDDAPLAPMHPKWLPGFEHARLAPGQCPEEAMLRRSGTVCNDRLQIKLLLKQGLCCFLRLHRNHFSPDANTLD